MKIRTDFVTNSSSSSFITFGVDLLFKNKTKVRWGPFYAFTEARYGLGDDFADFVNVEGDIYLKDLAAASSVEEFTETLYSFFKGESLYGDRDEDVQLFTLDENGYVWDEGKYGGIDQLKSMTIYTREEIYQGEKSKSESVTYDFTTGEYTSDNSNENDVIHADSGSGYITIHHDSNINDPQEFWKNERAFFEKNCKIIHDIPSFNGKTFVATGVENKDAVKEFLTEQGAFLRKDISGKTNYLIVYARWASERVYNAVLEQEKKGHTVEVIFYEDFVKYMNGDDVDSDDSDEPEEAATSDNGSDEVLSNIQKVGDRLIFNNAFSVDFSDKIDLTPEEDNLITLTRNGKNDEDFFSTLWISPLDVKAFGTLKAFIENDIKSRDGACGHINLYEDKNTEVAVLIQTQDHFIGTMCKFYYMIRVGDNSYSFYTVYIKEDLTEPSELNQDIKNYCNVFDNIRLTSSNKRIKTNTDDEKLRKLVDKLLGIESEAESDEEQQNISEKSARIAELNSQLDALTSQMQSGLSDMQAWAECERVRLEEEERKKKAAKNNRNASEEKILMYITVIIDEANKNERSDANFYSCYEDDFPALNKNSLSELRREVKAKMQNDPKIYEKEACALPYDKRFYYSAHNMFYTHNYSGESKEEIISLIFNTISVWFKESELSQVHRDIQQLFADRRIEVDESLSSVDEEWKSFRSAQSSLYIGLLDYTSEEYEPGNRLMVKYGNVLGAVQLANAGIFRIHTNLDSYFSVYWNVTIEDIWNAAKKNGIFDHREDKGDGQEERLAQEVYNKAMQNLGVAAQTISYGHNAP